jgi:site-specific DNA-methyltransferase (adenine-specific)
VLPSVADVDVSKLSSEALDTMITIARPMSEDGKTVQQLSVTLACEPREISRRLQELGDEMLALAGILVLPPLSADEYDALRDSIEANGQLVPILVDERGTVVDGSNRMRACKEIGVDPWIAPALIGDADELRHLALVANVARRHLTAGARRGLVVDELRREASRSDRSIALVVGVSPTTVGNVRQELVDAGTVPKLDTRVGRDGVTQPAVKPAVKTPPALPTAFAGVDQSKITVRTGPTTCPSCGHTWGAANV